ncbi:MAG: filamentous hemagglutinin N-terminal domain-containing protein, partial [Pseudomonadota bacterium]
MTRRAIMQRPRRRLLRSAATALALASLSLAGGAPAEAGPKGGVVKGGQASIKTRGGVTTIRQGSQRVVIDWRSFDIDAHEAVRFVQPDRGSIALNRVLDGMPTHIRGQLLANGNVWLVNPSGVMFHAGSVVDVGGLLATTADIENDAFLRGDYVFDKPGDPDARIVNEGRISFKDAGLAGFVAPEVVNRGEIAGRVGRIVIAGHERFSVDVSGDGMFELDLGPTGPEGGGRAVNLGRLAAEGGTIVLSAAAVRGAVEAAVHAGGVIEARSARLEGGAIILDGGGGRVEVTGALDVSGASGGEVRVEGAEIALREGARIDASGETGGGRVRIGGGRAGAGPAEGGLRAADRLEVAAGAFVTVSADRIGDGGEAIFWSQDATLFAGRVEGFGGAEGGDGGFVEISARLDLAFAGEVDLSAPLGAVGQVLFDPRDIVIVSDGSGDDVSGDVPAGQDPGLDIAINADSLTSITGDVTLQATRDITFAPGSGLLNIRSNSIAFEAGRDIVLNDSSVIGTSLAFRAGASLLGQPGDPQGAIRVSGSTQINALQSLAMTAPGGILGDGMSAADALTLRSRTAFAMPDADVAGGLDITVTSGALTLGEVAAASLAARAGAGLVFGGDLDIAGDAAFAAPGSPVSLTRAGNRFGG